MKVWYTRYKSAMALSLGALLGVMLTACGGGSSSNNQAGGGASSAPAPVAMIDTTFVVHSSDGALLTGVSVSFADKTKDSGAKGQVSFSLPAGGERVVSAKQEGFVPQSMRVDTASSAQYSIRLKPVGKTLSIDDVEAARTVRLDSLGATVTLPANAFVTPDGELASGHASMQITPWDIASADLNAMPANAQAKRADGSAARLISAGMLTVDTTNDDGEYLQLADGVSAVIQVDLPVDSVNNQTLSVGKTIPMWHFDLEQGLWLEDPDIMGAVVASPSSSVGLAVRAEVSHFSTWNWDFKIDKPGSISAECRMDDDSAVPCAITATVTLDDGSVFTRNGSLPAGGAIIINMPISATIHWQASTASGLLGELTSDMSGDVVIPIGEPTTSNQVQCQLPDSTPVACEVTVSSPDHSLTQTLGTNGATMAANWPELTTSSVLNWSAHTLSPVTYQQQTVVAEGSVSSAINDDITLTLAVTPVDEVTLQCQVPGIGTVGCNVDITADVGTATPFSASHLIQTSGSVPVPSAASTVHWSATGYQAVSQNGQFIMPSTHVDTPLVPNLTLVLDDQTVQGPAAQSMQVRCVNAASVNADTCDINVHQESSAVGYILLDSFADVPVGSYRTVNFPNGMPATNQTIRVSAEGNQSEHGHLVLNYASITDGQQADITLN